jgi:hypothetical protein
VATRASLAFQAPEQRTPAPLDRGADIYSLGSVLCFLLAGKAAADAHEADRTLKAVDGVPSGLAALCCRMMAADPGQRPSTMTAVLEELSGLGGPAPLPVPPPVAPPLSGNSDSTVGTASLESAKGKRLQPEGKAKKTPVARPLPAVAADADGIPVLAVGEKPKVEDASLLSGLKFDAPSRFKTPAKKAPVAAAALPAADPLQNSESPPELRRPVLALAIVGAVVGGLLFVAGIVAVVLLLVFGGRSDKRLAEAASPPLAAQVDAADSSSESETNPGEANPQEANPESEIAAPVDLSFEEIVLANNPPAASVPVEQSGGAADAPADEREAAEPPPAAPPAAEQPADPPSEPTPSAGEPAADLAPEPAPPAEPAPPEDPFAGFAAAVSLPVLHESSATPSEAMAPIALGPCKVSSKALVIARLKGGETVTRTKNKFELRAVDDRALQDWEIHLLSGNETITIATLGVKDEEIVFQWTPKAANEAAVANLLCNCALELNAGPKQLVVPLRKPVTGPPLALDLNRPNATVRWPIDFLPDTKQVYLEVQRLDGVEHQRIQPAGGVAAGSEVTLWAGPAAETLYLALRCDTSATTRHVEVRGLAQAQIEGVTRGLERFNRRDLGNKLQYADQQVAVLALTSRGAQEAEKDAEKRKRMKGSFDQRMGAFATQAEKIRKLLEFTAALAPALHFRVYYLADDHQVDLLITQAEEAPEENRPARKGKAGKAAEPAAAESPSEPATP